jgi:protein arginine N-methyltransferase 1
VVLDLGSGSGILALFACQAGARRVFAVEQQRSAGIATFLARYLQFGDRIEVIHEHSTNVQLPEPADLLVTETIAMFGLEERILSSVIDARSRLLRPGAAIIPQRLTLSAVPVELPGAFARHVGWWKEERYGFDLSPMSVFASNVLYGAEAMPESFLSPPAVVAAIDFATVADADVSGQARFMVERNGLLHGFAGWFAATLAPGLELSNERAGATHWRHAFLPLDAPVAVEQNAQIELEIATHDGTAWRWKGEIHSGPRSVSFDQTTWLAIPPG